MRGVGANKEEQTRQKKAKIRGCSSSSTKRRERSCRTGRLDRGSNNQPSAGSGYYPGIKEGPSGIGIPDRIGELDRFSQSQGNEKDKKKYSKKGSGAGNMLSTLTEWVGAVGYAGSRSRTIVQVRSLSYTGVRQRSLILTASSGKKQDQTLEGIEVAGKRL
ncbi:hypothetical protein CSA_000006 [Cucumis sativus]|uniref:Uncharacterized protein n=2 Tax=Cucumis sativus TaxID=3659 RepID=A0A0A0KCJ4_CUCSA|nr:hypothetical protein CSA_000006 [Cucumis sativus]